MTPSFAPITPTSPGAPSRVIQGFFVGGRPKTIQASALPVPAPVRPPVPGPVQGCRVPATAPIPAGRPGTGAVQPVLRPGQLPGPTMPAKAQAGGPPACDAAAPASPPTDLAAGADAHQHPAASGQRVCAPGQFHAQAPRQWPTSSRTDPEEDGVVFQHQFCRRPHPRGSRSPLDRRPGLHARHRPLLRRASTIPSRPTGNNCWATSWLMSCSSGPGGFAIRLVRAWPWCRTRHLRPRQSEWGHVRQRRAIPFRRNRPQIIRRV